jgi:hypothetical protein
MSPLFHLPDEIFEKMDICRVIDINNNSHGPDSTPTGKTTTSVSGNGRVLSIAHFNLLTIINDPVVMHLAVLASSFMIFLRLFPMSGLEFRTIKR